MESKQVGALLPMLSEMVQELQYIYRDSIPRDTRDRQVSLRLVLFHLGESYQLLTKLSEEEASTRTGL